MLAVFNLDNLKHRGTLGVFDSVFVHLFDCGWLS